MANTPPPIAYHILQAMHTRLDLVFPNFTKKDTEFLTDKIRYLVYRIELQLSRFVKDSLPWRINNRQSGCLQLTSDDYHCLLLCKAYLQRSNCYFNPSVLGLMDQADASAEYMGFDCVEWDNQKKTINITHPSFKLDLGGFAKGYALEKIIALLRDHGIESALINFGNSSLYALGSPPHAPVWPIGISHIYQPQELVYSFQLKDQALSTSGLSSIKSNSNNQIINPFTREVLKQAATLTVSGPSPLDCEVLSTALFAAPNEQRREILNNFPDCQAVEINYRDQKALANII